MLCVILLGLAAASCRSYVVPDFRTCSELRSGDGFCISFTSGTELEIPKEEYGEWKAEHNTMDIPARDVTDIIVFIEKVCADSEKCITEEELIESLKRMRLQIEVSK